MTTIGIASRPLSEADHSTQLRRAVIASTVGTTIEWYDFLLYGTVTGLVFGKLFFPKSDPLVGVLQAFAVYSVGFIARPIGAMVFGHYAGKQIWIACLAIRCEYDRSTIFSAWGVILTLQHRLKLIGPSHHQNRSLPSSACQSGTRVRV